MSASSSLSPLSHFSLCTEIISISKTLQISGKFSRQGNTAQLLFPATMMALKQPIVAPKHTPLFHQNPSPISHFQFLSLNPNRAPRRFSSTAAVRCSFNYGSSNSTGAGDDGLYEYERYASVPSNSPRYPKPAEIQWKKELCNSVQLIGVVGTPVQIKQFPSGKVLASCCLAVRKSQTDTTWINLSFWDELANIAFEHVQKGQQIFVSGRLVSDVVEGDDGKQQTYYKVVAQDLNFIEKTTSSSIPLYNGDSNSATPSRKQNSYAANSTSSPEELWQAYFANPLEWWDNRKNKRTPNYPDFKHKDTGEALWIEGRQNPPWVKSQLAVLDAKMEAYREQTSGGMHPGFMSAADSLGSY